MENQQQRWVNLSFLAAAALIGFILYVFGSKIAGTYDLEAKVRNIDMIIRIGSIVLAGISFVVLSRHEQASQFMTEVVVELQRVTWPTSKETTNATVVVMIMVVASGLFLGLLDYIWTRLLQWVL